jgi:Uma2 family endonuclease
MLQKNPVPGNDAMSLETPPETDLTLQEIFARVGDVPYWRIRSDPPPGTATEEDVERIRCQEDRLYELIDGVLVEKAVSEETAILAVELMGILREFVKPRRLGWIVGPDGYYRVYGDRLRAPDVSFVPGYQRPQGYPMTKGYPAVAPPLVVEVFSPGNSESEMQHKREEFFASGTELFWIVYPRRQEIEVWTSPQVHRTLGRDDVLDCGCVLSEFSVNVADIFDALRLRPGSAGSHPPAG